MKKIIIFISLLFLFLLFFSRPLSIPTFKIDRIVNEKDLSSDCSYKVFKGTTNSFGNLGHHHISVIRASKDYTIRPYASISTKGMIGKTVSELATEYIYTHPLDEVIAAINGDYFSYDGEYIYPVNSYIENGNVINYKNHPRYMSLVFNSSTEYIYTKENKITNNYYLTVFDKNNIYPIKTIKLSKPNIYPQINETTFFKGIKDIENNYSVFYFDQLTNNLALSSHFIKGAITKNLRKSLSNLSIITKNEEVEKILNSNTNIIIQKQLDGIFNRYKNSIGVGSHVLSDGNIRTVHDIQDQSKNFAETKHPRSSIGFSKNGDIYLAAIDGRRIGMNGATLQEEAAIMKSLGCLHAFNLDGGGSTQLVINENGILRYLNNPLMPIRDVVNIILIIKKKSKIDFSYEISKELEFKYNVSNVANLKNIKVLIDGVQVNNSIVLKKNNIYTLSVIGTSTINNSIVLLNSEVIYL